MLLSARSRRLLTTLRCFSARSLSPVQCLSTFRNFAPLTSHIAIGSLHFGIGRDQSGAVALQRFIPARFRSLDHFPPWIILRAMSWAFEARLSFHHIEIITGNYHLLAPRQA
jgi:hypothetical protein